MAIDFSPRALAKHETFAVEQMLPLIDDYARANGLSRDEAVVSLFLAMSNVLIIPRRTLVSGIEAIRPREGGVQ